MLDVLLPRTDAGVLVQGLVLFPALLAALLAVRRDRDWRILVIGLLVFGVSFFALRAMH